MEDLLPITETEQASFCVELTKRLNMQRKQGHLCDLTLVKREGKELMAHSNVLSAVSPFFHKLLQSDMKESHERIVRLEEISGSVMEDVLNFTYTGTVEVTEENAEELIVVANYLLHDIKLESYFRSISRADNEPLKLYFNLLPS